jgi:hypothetical protein
LNNPKIIVNFAPGAFDDFEGTQEELDSLVNEITKTFQNISPEKLLEDSILTDWESTSSQRSLQ